MQRNLSASAVRQASQEQWSRPMDILMFAGVDTVLGRGHSVINHRFMMMMIEFVRDFARLAACEVAAGFCSHGVEVPRRIEKATHVEPLVTEAAKRARSSPSTVSCAKMLSVCTGYCMLSRRSSS